MITISTEWWFEKIIFFVKKTREKFSYEFSTAANNNNKVTNMLDGKYHKYEPP